MLGGELELVDQALFRALFSRHLDAAQDRVEVSIETVLNSGVVQEIFAQARWPVRPLVVLTQGQCQLALDKK